MALVVSRHQNFNLDDVSFAVHSLEVWFHWLSKNIEGFVVIAFPWRAVVSAVEDAALGESASSIETVW
eukprot:CAMPEP_0172314456 /NCGR_PEP_ID=MMETSP1058-20130122/22585_1 /TAXON_ID=83371 /ORGANISM="Detonula confervacea, Strain CCMP 353" /LENGTH=67 /DNA_ID=CAMNT_0013028331 /DNA_START=129 /DNA_END=329 /DNA_ORIENTATION=-